jgi:hypothetical protein
MQSPEELILNIFSAIMIILHKEPSWTAIQKELN